MGESGNHNVFQVIVHNDIKIKFFKKRANAGKNMNIKGASGKDSRK